MLRILQFLQELHYRGVPCQRFLVEISMIGLSDFTRDAVKGVGARILLVTDADDSVWPQVSATKPIPLFSGSRNHRRRVEQPKISQLFQRSLRYQSNVLGGKPHAKFQLDSCNLILHTVDANVCAQAPAFRTSPAARC